jgi:Flp pilus assembly protein TadD
MSDADSGEAIPYLVKGVAEEKTNASAWLALGIAYQNVGRDAEAKGPYREFLKLRPQGAQADEVRQALKFIP